MAWGLACWYSHCSGGSCGSLRDTGGRLKPSRRTMPRTTSSTINAEGLPSTPMTCSMTSRCGLLPQPGGRAGSRLGPNRQRMGGDFGPGRSLVNAAQRMSLRPPPRVKIRLTGTFSRFQSPWVAPDGKIDSRSKRRPWRRCWLLGWLHPEGSGRLSHLNP